MKSYTEILFVQSTLMTGSHEQNWKNSKST